jgi:putative aminopeptidase FrvX
VALPETLAALLRAPGASGHEQLAFGAVRDAVGDVAEIETDAVGNLVARQVPSPCTGIRASSPACSRGG